MPQDLGNLSKQQKNLGPIGLIKNAELLLLDLNTPNRRKMADGNEH